MPRSLKSLSNSYHAIPGIDSERDRAFPLLSSELDLPGYFSPWTLDEHNDSFKDTQTPFQWFDTNPLIPDADSDYPWNSLSSSAHDQSYNPIDENSYLTWSYAVSDVHPSLYAPSALPSHPSSPSMSIVSASTEDSVLSPPPSLAEFGNTFEFDFNASLPNEMQPSASSQQWFQLPGQRSQPSNQSAYSTSSCPSPDNYPTNAECSEPRPALSREPSPNQSDSDQNNPRRRYPCLILGCTRRFTSQYTLKVHMEAHKPKPRVTFPCTLGCSEKFSRQHDRLRHEVAKHGKVCEFSCEDCGRFFSSQKTLGNHKCPVAQGTRWVNNS